MAACRYFVGRFVLGIEAAQRCLEELLGKNQAGDMVSWLAAPQRSVAVRVMPCIPYTFIFMPISHFCHTKVVVHNIRLPTIHRPTMLPRNCAASCIPSTSHQFNGVLWKVWGNILCSLFNTIVQKVHHAVIGSPPQGYTQLLTSLQQQCQLSSSSSLNTTWRRFCTC